MHRSTSEPRDVAAGLDSVDPTRDDLFEFSLKSSEVLKRFSWSFFTLAAIRGKGLFTLPLAIAILGANGYGETTVALAMTSFLAPIILLNVPDGAALLVVGAPTPEVAYGHVGRIRRFGVLVAVLSLFAGVCIALLLGNHLPLWVGTLTASAVLFKVATVHMQYFQQVARFARLDLVAEYGAVAAGLALAVPFGVAGMLAANSAVIAIAAMVAWRMFSHRTTRPQKPFWGPALRLALPLLPCAFMLWALLSIDSVLIFHYLGDGPTGAYASAYSIASIAMLVPLALNSVWYATAQRLLARSLSILIRFSFGVTALVIAVGAILIGMALVAGPLLTEKWLVDPVFHAVPDCLPWLVLGFTALALSKVAEGIVYAFAHPRWILAASMVAGTVNIGLNLLWIPTYGIVGAAWATAAGYGVLAVLLTGFALAAIQKNNRGDSTVVAN